MSDWKTIRIGDHATTFAGGTPDRTKPEFFGGSIPWVKSTEVNHGRIKKTEETLSELGFASSAAKWIPANTVLVALYGATAAQVGFLTFKATANQAVLAVLPDNLIDPDFLFYSLSAAKDRILYKAQGSGQPNLNKQIIDNFRLDVPNPSEQRKIARILTTVDNLIEKTESLIAKYQAIKQGMMHDLFTRGVDEHGHLRPSYADAPDQYKKSELGWIPKEWWVATIGGLFDKRTQHGMEGLPVMSIVMRDGLVERSSVDRRVESNLPPQGHALVLKGDIAYNMMRMWQGVLGRALFDCLVSPAYVVLKPKDTINTHFAALLFSDERSIQKFRQFSQGVVDDRLRLYFHDLVDIAFAVPTSLDEQEEIARRVEACNKRIATEKTALEQYQQLRLGLMQDLLTGRVRVKVDEAEEVAAHA